MSLDSVGKHIEKLLAHAQFRQQTDYRQSEEWHTIQAVMLHALAPFPDAEQAAREAVARIEQMRCPDLETVHHTIAQALKPFLEARIAVADALAEASKAA